MSQKKLKVPRLGSAPSVHLKRLSRAALAALFIIPVVFVAGCLSRPPLSKEYFFISVPAQARTNHARSDEVLSVRVVTMAPQFEGRSLVYRVSDHAYEMDVYAEFVIPPEQMLGVVVREWLRGTGPFQDVAEPASLVYSTRMAELHVTEMYGDFRQPSNPLAVFTMRFILLPKESSREKPPLAKVYSRRIKIRERTAAGVVAGLQEALKETLSELTDDLGRL